jgi:nucleotide-binding universal stress UspA family protein
MFKNILVGVDGSEKALKAASVAGEMARCMGASLWVVVCYESIPKHLGEPYLQQTISGRMDQSQEILAPALEVVGVIPGNLQTEVLEGSPAETILSVAEACSVDLIVMGTRGLGRVAGAILGSQSQKVVSNALCPVLLVT